MEKRLIRALRGAGKRDVTLLDHLKEEQAAAAAAEGAELNLMLSDKLKERLAGVLADAGHTLAASRIEKMPEIAVSDKGDLTLRDLAEPLLKDAAAEPEEVRQKIADAVDRLSDQTTVSDLLGLDRKIGNSGVARKELRAAALADVVATTPGLGEKDDLAEQFAVAYAEAGADPDGEAVWRKLARRKAFTGKRDVIEAIQLTLQLDNLADGDARLLGALQERRAAGEFGSMRDLAEWGAERWRDVVAQAGADGGKEGVEARAAELEATLRRAYPTAMAIEALPEQAPIDAELLRRVAELNPDLVLGDEPPRPLRLNGISGNETTRAREALLALHREAVAFPALDAARAVAESNGALRNPIREGVERFLAGEKDFDLLEMHVDDYVAKNPAAIEALGEEREKALDQIKLTQRIVRAAPQLPLASALIGSGYKSALDIAGTPEDQFVEAMRQALGGEEKARAIHAKSRDIAGLSLALVGTVWHGVHDVVPQVVGSVDLSSMPDYAQLFGSVDYCDCEECRSVFSPAAYLVDLLQSINPKQAPAVGIRPLTALLQRRPDLRDLKLSCENTNTPLPYVDLVNEVLESYVVRQHPIAHDTSEDARADELLANPEFVEEQAYNTLASAVHPFSLPFDRPTEIARIYLGELGSSRAEVMELLGAADLPARTAAAAERVGIGPAEFRVVTGTRFDGTPAPVVHPAHELYGYTSATVDGQSWRQNVCAVEEFRKRAGVEFEHVVELLETRFVNHSRTAPDPNLVVIHDDSGSCDASTMRLQHLSGSTLTDAELVAIQALIRLWRRLGWSIADVDRGIAAFGASAIDAALVRSLGEALAVRDSLKLKLGPLFALWGTIDTFGDDSLYASLFQNRAVRELAPADFDPFALNASRTELAIVGMATPPVPALISAHRASIAAALGRTPEEVATLAGHVAPNDLLNLANLSALLRESVLARALRMKLDDVFRMRTLTGINPYADPGQTLLFATTARKAARSGFTAPVLDYLLRGVSDPAATLPPAPPQLAQTVRALREGLRRIVTDNTTGPDPDGGTTRTKLAMLLEPEAVVAVMGLLAGTAELRAPLASLPAGLTFTPALAARVRYDAVAHELVYSGPMTAADRTALLGLSSNGPYQTAVQSLHQQPRDTIAAQLGAFLDPVAGPAAMFDAGMRPEQRYQYVLDRMMEYLRASLSRALVIQSLAQALRVDPPVADVLVSRVLNSRADAAQPMIADFLAVVDLGVPGRYFQNPGLSGASNTRIDAGIDFDWTGGASPAPGPGAFSARWEGQLLSPTSDDVTFTVNVAGGVRLFVGGQTVIDQWTDHQPAGDVSGTIPL
jgi:hypothetical protein